MNRLSYDTCSYNKALGESIAPLDYMLDIAKFEHCNKCRVELGLIGGTAVSHVQGDLVDLENDLRGQNRPNTHCPSFKHLPSDTIQGKEYIKPVCHPKIDVSKMDHMNSCQFQDFPPTPCPPKDADAFTCGA
jgi:hypothetical protein